MCHQVTLKNIRKLCFGAKLHSTKVCVYIHSGRRSIDVNMVDFLKVTPRASRSVGVANK